MNFLVSLLCVLMVSPLIGSDVAQHPSRPQFYEKYTLIHVSKKTSYVNKSKALASCRAQGKVPITCTITKGKTATRSFGVALKIPIKTVAAELGISQQTSVTLTTGCSARIKSGQTLYAYPVGTRYKYKVKKVTKGSIMQYYNGTTISSWQYTFNPYKNDIACIVK